MLVAAGTDNVQPKTILQHGDGVVRLTPRRSSTRPTLADFKATGNKINSNEMVQADTWNRSIPIHAEPNPRP